MPTYEYECSHCGQIFEKFQSISSPPAKRCPKCRHGVKRLIGTGAGIIFKGSGFYETDYRSDSYKSAAKKDVDTTSVSKTETKDTKSTKKSGGDKKGSD